MDHSGQLLSNLNQIGLRFSKDDRDYLAHLINSLKTGLASFKDTSFHADGEIRDLSQSYSDLMQSAQTMNSNNAGDGKDANINFVKSLVSFVTNSEMNLINSDGEQKNKLYNETLHILNLAGTFLLQSTDDVKEKEKLNQNLQIALGLLGDSNEGKVELPTKELYKLKEELRDLSAANESQLNNNVVQNIEKVFATLSNISNDIVKNKAMARLGFDSTNKKLKKIENEVKQISQVKDSKDSKDFLKFSVNQVLANCNELTNSHLELINGYEIGKNVCYIQLYIHIFMHIKFVYVNMI